MSTDEPTREATPSGGWVVFRTTAEYGARRKLKEFSSRMTAKVSLKKGLRQKDIEKGHEMEAVEDITLDAEAVSAQMLAEEYFPVVYMVAAWSYGDKLPTLEDLTPLDSLAIDDGDFIVEEATRRYEALTQVRVTPDDQADADSPFESSSASNGRSKASASSRDLSPITTTS